MNMLKKLLPKMDSVVINGLQSNNAAKGIVDSIKCRLGSNRDQTG